ncbi:universal stress protein [Uliginosibacterium flavum]|uniref:Universal stress protein n=1 Tax=Uliginosibacterium flavum TaxID=1396831 RepID=A0ABV2TJ75_9RHOO
MNYSSLMVNLELGHLNTDLLKITGDLAESMHASVIGIAACNPKQLPFDGGYIAAEYFEQDRQQIEMDRKETETEFRNALQSRIGALEWRSSVLPGSIADYLANEARSADLLISALPSGTLFDTSRRVDISDLIMQTGRPVLLVPSAITAFTPNRVLIAWKDTRESRHAISVALSLLKQATQISIVEIATQEEEANAHKRLADVVSWLKRHGVIAEPIVSPSSNEDASRLTSLAQEQDIDLIVAGAYGHSRLREWALGGMTRDILLRAQCCTLVAH